MFVKKAGDVSLTFFSAIPTVSGFNAKSITFIIFIWHLFRSIQMLAGCFLYFLSSKSLVLLQDLH